MIGTLQRKQSSWIVDTGDDEQSSPANTKFATSLVSTREGDEDAGEADDNEEVLFEGSKNYVSLAIVVDYRFVRYKKEGICEIQAYTPTSGVTAPSICISVAGLMKNIFEDDVIARVAKKKSEFLRANDMQYVEMPADDEFRMPALIELSVAWLKDRIYVKPGSTFEIALKPLENDVVGKDRRHTFYVVKPPPLAKQPSTDSVPGMLRQMSSRKQSYWATSLRSMDPHFSQKMLPQQLKDVTVEERRDAMRRRCRFLVHVEKVRCVEGKKKPPSSGRKGKPPFL